MICASCGFENDSGAEACTHCGQALGGRCPACGAEVPAGFAFCGRCGARLEEARAPAERGDRRVVSVLFADLSGFTPLAEQLDPEDLTALVNECFGALREEVRLRDGWLEKQIGDALVAVFGAPLAHEDDPLRAVRVGWAMHERMRALRWRLEPGLGRPLQLHIGINTGLVVMGSGLEAGEGSGDELVVLGDSVNVAARLQQAAKAGQLLVGEATYSATSSAFDYRKLPPLAVKGKQEKLVAYECLGPRSASRPGVAEVTRFGTPLVGRDGELAFLGERLAQLAVGEGGIVAIVGEAGLGKSRLMAEARQRMVPGLRWLEGRAMSFGQAIAYFPFLEILKAEAGIGEDEFEEESFKKLEARLAALLPEAQLPEVLPYLAVLLSLDVPDALSERVRYLDGEAMRQQLFRASRLTFEALARERPTVLVFEDCHWADASSEALIEHLLPLVEELPLLVCLPARPDPETPAARLRRRAGELHTGRYGEIALSQLSGAEATELVHHLLQIELPPRLRQVFAKTEGNPFFLEEVARSLIELGAFERDEAGRFRVAAAAEEVTIPDTIQGVIMARVDRLDEEAKQLLRTASVIGRNFPHQVLQALTTLNGRLDPRLAELETLELIRKRHAAGELEYIFKHALTRDAIYESILLRRRRELHGQVAGAIETLFPERLDEFHALLAYHYAQAEDWERAQEYLFKAGDQAVKLAADAEALAHYRQALAAHARVFGERWDPVERAALERKMGEALFRRGQNDEALEHMHRALVQLGSPYPARVRPAILRALLRQLGHRVLPWLFLRGVPAEAGAAAQERGRIYETLGWLDYSLDPERLFLDSLLMLNDAEESNFAFAVVSGCMGLGLVWDHIPAPRLADYYHRRAIAVAEQIQHTAGVALAHFGLTYHLFVSGRFDECVEHSQRAMDAFRQAGDLSKWAAPAVAQAIIARRQGRFVEALDRCGKIVRTGEEIGDDRARMLSLLEFGRVLLRLGDLDEALECLREAIELAQALPDYPSLVAGKAALAQAHIARGDLQGALALLAETERLVTVRRFRGYEATDFWNGLAEAHLLSAEGAAGAERGAFLKKAKPACKAARRQGRLERAALPAAHRLQGRYHWLRGSAKAAARSWREGVRIAEELGARYDLALTYVEVGRRTGDAAQAARGEALLAELGVARERPAAAVEAPAAVSLH